MLIKTSELTGAALDWVAAKCAGILVSISLSEKYGPAVYSDSHGDFYAPSTNWSQGGPLNEREGITISKTAHGFWEAYKRPASTQECYQVNDTPLIAAMRCYVASKLGDEVEVPQELL